MGAIDAVMRELKNQSESSLLPVSARLERLIGNNPGIAFGLIGRESHFLIRFFASNSSSSVTLYISCFNRVEFFSWSDERTNYYSGHRRLLLAADVPTALECVNKSDFITCPLGVFLFASLFASRLQFVAVFASAPLLIPSVLGSIAFLKLNFANRLLLSIQQ